MVHRWSYLHQAPWGPTVVGELELAYDGALHDRLLDTLEPGSSLGSWLELGVVNRSDEWGTFVGPDEVELFLKAELGWILGERRSTNHVEGGGVQVAATS